MSETSWAAASTYNHYDSCAFGTMVTENINRYHLLIGGVPSKSCVELSWYDQWMCFYYHWGIIYKANTKTSFELWLLNQTLNLEFELCTSFKSVFVTACRFYSLCSGVHSRIKVYMSVSVPHTQYTERVYVCVCSQGLLVSLTCQPTIKKWSKFISSSKFLVKYRGKMVRQSGKIRRK